MLPDLTGECASFFTFCDPAKLNLIPVYISFVQEMSNFDFISV